MSTPTQPVVSSSQPESAQSWMRRHPKTLVFAIKLAIAVSVFGTILGIVSLVMWSMRQSDVFRLAMEKTRKNPAVVEKLGTPIEPDWMVTGSMNVDGDSGTANFTAEIKGPRQKGKLSIDARKRMGEWTFNYLMVKTAAGEEIDVVPRKTD